MSKVWMGLIGGLVVIVAGGVGLYLSLHTRPVATQAVAVPAMTEAKGPAADLIPDVDIAAVAEALAEAKPGITLTQWKASHPGEEEAGNESFGMSCMTLRWNQELADGNSLTGYAAFFPPEPPKPLALPSGQEPEALVEQCTLASIRVVLTVDSRDKLLRSVPKIRDTFTARLGNAGEDPAVRRAFGPLWKAGDAKVMIERAPDVNPAIAGKPGSKASWMVNPRLTMRADLPNLRWESSNPEIEYQAVSPEASPEVFQLAVKMAAIGKADLVQTMNELYQDCYKNPLLAYDHDAYKNKGTTPGLERGKKVVDVLAQWIAATCDLPPQRKSAGLLAAYFLLKDATDRLEIAEMQAMRAWLMDAKVIGSEEELTNWQLTPKWANDARSLDPGGPIGDAVLLMTITDPLAMYDLLPHEYRPTRKMPDGRTIDDPIARSEGQKDATDYVIEMGQKYLAVPHDAEMTERVEYFIASAYCDRIQLAGGVGDLSEKPSDFQIQRGAAAKAEALKYFTMAMDHNSPRSVTAWSEGWRVLAGLPVVVHFFELGD